MKNDTQTITRASCEIEKQLDDHVCPNTCSQSSSLFDQYPTVDHPEFPQYNISLQEHLETRNIKKTHIDKVIENSFETLEIHIKK